MPTGKPLALQRLSFGSPSVLGSAPSFGSAPASFEDLLGRVMAMAIAVADDAAGRASVAHELVLAPLAAIALVLDRPPAARDQVKVGDELA